MDSAFSTYAVDGHEDVSAGDAVDGNRERQGDFVELVVQVIRRIIAIELGKDSSRAGKYNRGCTSGRCTYER